MNTLQTNDWLILNSIIYEIYTTADFDQMRRKFLEQMKMLVDFDSADFYLASSNEKENIIYHKFSSHSAGCRQHMELLLSEPIK